MENRALSVDGPSFQTPYQTTYPHIHDIGCIIYQTFVFVKPQIAPNIPIKNIKNHIKMFENLEKYLDFVMIYLKMFEKDLGVFYIGIVRSNELFVYPPPLAAPKRRGYKRISQTPIYPYTVYRSYKGLTNRDV